MNYTRNEMYDKMFFVRNSKRDNLAAWVYAERAKRKWSQADLADRMGKVRAVVNKIENASNDPTLDTLEALANAFGYNIAVVLNVLGYDVGSQGEDPWVLEQLSKLDKINPILRPLAEKLISSVSESEQNQNTSLKEHKTTPAKP